MKKRYLAVMAATMTTMAVTACSGNQTTTETTAVETTTAAASAVTTATETSAAETTAAAAEKPIQEKPLVVYLNDFDGVIGDLFKEATGLRCRSGCRKWCGDHVQDCSRKRESTVGCSLD